MYTNDLSCLQKSKRIRVSNTNNKNIQSGHRDGILHRKICDSNNKKRSMTSKGKNRTAKLQGIKKTYKYLGIPTPNTIKYVKMREKFF